MVTELSLAASVRAAWPAEFAPPTTVTGWPTLAVQLQFSSEFLHLSVVNFGPTQAINRAMLGGGHEPRAGIVRNTRSGPLLQRGDQRFLGEVLGNADITHHPGQAGDQPRRLDPPNRIDSSVDVSLGHGDRRI